MLNLLYFLIPVIAFLYAGVGFGGATGYLAVMSFFGVAPQVMADTALVLNILVAGISFISFYRARHFRLTDWAFPCFLLECWARLQVVILAPSD
jgi:uncharacterized membrane protein YfcA